MQNQRDADVETARVEYVNLWRVCQWIAFALVAGGCLWSRPELVTSIPLILLVIAFMTVVPTIGRTRLVTADQRRRLWLEQLIVSVLLAAILVVGGTAVRGLILTLVLPIALAPLLLESRAARWVLVGGLLAVVVVDGLAWRDAGRLVAVEASSAAAAFAFVYYLSVGLCQRITVMQRRLQSLVERDQLTHTYSLSSFLERGQQTHAQAAAARRPYALLIVDVENLRAINERYGYAAGTRAIGLVATALERLRNPDELIGRYDGDKFVILVPRVEGSRVADLAQRIRNVVFSTTLNLEMQVVRIKAHVGTAKFPVDGTTLDRLLAQAETDMRADRNGRAPPTQKIVFKRRSVSKPA